MIMFGQARPSTCSIILSNAKNDGWFSWSTICLPLSLACDFELAAILVQSHHVFLLDSAHKYDALVSIRTNTLQLATPKRQQQLSCLKDLLEVN